MQEYTFLCAPVQPLPPTCPTLFIHYKVATEQAARDGTPVLLPRPPKRPQPLKTLNTPCAAPIPSPRARPRNGHFGCQNNKIRGPPVALVPKHLPPDAHCSMKHADSRFGCVCYPRPRHFIGRIVLHFWPPAGLPFCLCPQRPLRAGRLLGGAPDAVRAPCEHLAECDTNNN